MKKFLAAASSLVLVLLPGFVLAAYNDVSLAIPAKFTTFSGITVNVNGATNVESVRNDGSIITVTMQNNSGIVLSAPNLNQLTVSSANGATTNTTCNASVSSVTISAIVAATVTITPSATLCSASSSGGNGQVVSGGGGGGGGTYTPPVTTTPNPPAATDKNAQLTALKNQLNAPPGQISTQGSSKAVASFARDLHVGSAGNDVKGLQVYLNTHGYGIASKGAGSKGHETTTFGNATRAALIKLQKAAGIKPASGNFGPLTRAYIAAHQ